VLLADEPTGNLDTANGEEVMAILERLNRERGVAVVLVTHEAEIAARARRLIRIRDGLVVEDTRTDGARTDGTAPIVGPVNGALNGAALDTTLIDTALIDTALIDGAAAREPGAESDGAAGA
jgi:energy-coupling factor transporter ATP-binding protein EcfA2